MTDTRDIAEHASRVAILDGLLRAVQDALAHARADAERVFRDARVDVPQVIAHLPGDTRRLGLISVYGATREAKIREDKVLAWARVNEPGSVERFVDPVELRRPEIIDLIAGQYPGLVHERVRPADRERLGKSLAERDGKLWLNAGGELAEVGTVIYHPVTGRFAYKPDDWATDRVMEAFRDGTLVASGVNLGEFTPGRLALPPARRTRPSRARRAGAASLPPAPRPLRGRAPGAAARRCPIPSARSSPPGTARAVRPSSSPAGLCCTWARSRPLSWRGISPGRGRASEMPLNRTPLKRYKPLASGGGLSRSAPLTSTSQLRRTPLARRAQPMRHRSAKTAAVYVSRRRLVAELFAEPVMCEVPRCARWATDPHEPKTRARLGSILNRLNVRLICREHHSEIHDTEPAWAYELGFLIHSWDPEPGAAAGEVAALVMTHTRAWPCKPLQAPARCRHTRTHARRAHGCREQEGAHQAPPGPAAQARRHPAVTKYER